MMSRSFVRNENETPAAAGTEITSSPQRARANRVEYGLALALGLSVPFASYPLARVFGFPLDVAHLLGAILILFAAVGVLNGSRSLPGRTILVATALVAAAALSGLLR